MEKVTITEGISFAPQDLAALVKTKLAFLNLGATPYYDMMHFTAEAPYNDFSGYY